MPCLRGIDVKLVTYPAKQIIQEYPHPDGISLRLVTRQEAAAAFAKGLSTASASPSSSEPAVPSRKVDPKSSVYISTQPGSQFIIAYDIHEVPDACKFLNFKVFINGRHMVTCGQDLNQRTRGVICQTLWAPSNNHYAGIEGREFMFLPDKTKKSAAEDGGLIEVQVHRAAARSLRSPSLQEFRQAREYGLATPSTGLIQRPEEVKWYKYHLVDAKDTPYARFFFHYRSYGSLKELNLIPEESLEEPKHIPEKKPCRLSKQQPPHEVEDASRSSTPEASFLWLDGAADDDRPVPRSSDRSERQRQAQPTNPPAQNSQPRRGENVTASGQVGRIDLSSLIIQRPLPRRPLPEPPLGGLAPPPRFASQSPAPSLSPSLKRRVDEGDFDDDIEIAEPKIVRYNKVHDKPTLRDVAPGRNSTSSSNLPRSGSTVYRPPRGTIPPRGTSLQSYRPAASAATVYEPSSFSARGMHIMDTMTLSYPGGGRESSSQRLERSQSQTRSQRHENEPTSSQPTSSRPAQHASRQPERPRADEMMQGVIGQQQRRPTQPLNLIVPTYRGADTTNQAQVQRPSRRQRPADLDLSSIPPPNPQRPTTYNALRDMGAAMLSGSTFRRNNRNTQGQSPTDRNPARNSRDAQVQSPKSSMQSSSSRYSSPTTTPNRSSLADQRWTPRNAPPEPQGGVSLLEALRQTPPHESTTTPPRSSLADQRWTPRNAPPEPRGGVSLLEALRQPPPRTPQREGTIDRIIADLNRSDDSKENRPPPDRSE